MGSLWKATAAVCAALALCAVAAVFVFPDQIAERFLTPAQGEVQGGPQFLLEVEPGDMAMDRAIVETIEIIKRRLYELGGATAVVRQEGANRIVIQVPPSQDARRFLEVATRPGKLEFRLIDTSILAQQALQRGAPAASEILYGPDKAPYLIEKRVILSGRDLRDAQPAFDQRTNEPIVTFRFNPSGTRRFAQATQENVGKAFAIVFDGEVVSAPVIREPILGGSGQISGNFTVQGASDLALLLRSGELPARLKVIEQRAQ